MKPYDKLIFDSEIKLFNMGTIIEVLAKPDKRSKIGYELIGTIMSEIICCPELRESLDQEYTEIQGDGTLLNDDFGTINFCPNCGKKVWVKIRMIK